MKKLFKSLWCAYLLWKMGFFLSENTSKYEWKDEGEKRMDGFLRLNFENGKIKKYAVVDFDFLFSNGKLIFVNVKGGKDNSPESTFRYDAKK